jgi:hypothetical protein
VIETGANVRLYQSIPLKTYPLNPDSAMRSASVRDMTMRNLPDNVNNNLLTVGGLPLVRGEKSTRVLEFSNIYGGAKNSWADTVTRQWPSRKQG